MKTDLFITSRMNYDIARRSITKTCLLMRKRANLSRKEVAKLLGISDYALEHYEGLHIIPPSLLTKALEIYKISVHEFLDTACDLIPNVCEYCIETGDQSLKEISNHIDVFTVLYDELKIAWENTTDISVEILNQWIEYTNIYYVYYILIKRKFIKNDQYEFMKKQKLRIVEQWFIVFYDIPLELLENENINNIPVWIMYYRKRFCKNKQERDLLDHNIKLISLASYVR